MVKEEWKEYYTEGKKKGKKFGTGMHPKSVYLHAP